jgi:hypothetical protein
MGELNFNTYGYTEPLKEPAGLDGGRAASYLGTAEEDPAQPTTPRPLGPVEGGTRVPITPKTEELASDPSSKLEIGRTALAGDSSEA